MDHVNWIADALFLADWMLRIGLSVRVLLRRLPVGVSLAWLMVILIVPYVGAILYLVLGVALMLGLSLVDYRTWQRWAPALYIANLFLLLFILRGGHSAMGAQRWISLGPLGTFQPSEPAKLAVAIALAAVLRQEIAVERMILLAEEGARAAVAALGDMVRNTGDDDAGEAGHAKWWIRRSQMSIECTVTVIEALVLQMPNKLS